MTLRELEARFLKLKENGFIHNVAFEEAQGIEFLCPSCFIKDNGPIGTHWIICWFADRGVPDNVFPGPERWPVSGTGLDDLTLNPSILICDYHGYIINGQVSIM